MAKRIKHNAKLSDDGGILCMIEATSSMMELELELELELNENENGSAEKSEDQRRNFVLEEKPTLSETVHWNFKKQDGRDDIGTEEVLTLYPSQTFHSINQVILISYSSIVSRLCRCVDHPSHT